MSRKRIYIVSAAGIPNFGDELITRGWIRWIEINFPCTEIHLDCMDPIVAKRLFEGDHPKIYFHNFLWGLAWKFRDAPVSGHECVRAWVRSRARRHISVFLESDVMHVVGGGYLSQEWPWNFTLLSIVSEIKQNRPNLRLYGTGLGMSPMGNEHLDYVKLALQDFNYIDVRDHDSAVRTGARLGSDDAFLAMQVGIVPVHKDAPTHMLLIQRDVLGEGLHASKLLEKSLHILSDIGGDECEIGVVEAYPGSDGWYWDALQTQWKGTIRRYPWEKVWSNGIPVRPGQSWITTRFHPHLIAASVGAAGIAINTDSCYYDIKHLSLIRIGTGWGYVRDGVTSTGIRPTLNKDFPLLARSFGKERADLAGRLYSFDVIGDRAPSFMNEVRIYIDLFLEKAKRQASRWTRMLHNCFK